ncbi:MAG: SIS domain-containing protein [Planctomycetota bacterium]
MDRTLVDFISERLLARAAISGPFFAAHAGSLAQFAQQAAERLFVDGRLLAFGCGAQVTDAQHVAVEFVHPGIVGKPALPALDVSGSDLQSLAVLVQEGDVVLAFGPPSGDPRLAPFLQLAREHGALTMAVPSGRAAGDGAADLELPAPTSDAFVHQELLMTVYHVLWEVVHVFGEHRGMDHDAGGAAFLYPFLGSGLVPRSEQQATLASEVATQIITKAQDGGALRAQCAAGLAAELARAAIAIAARLEAGGRILAFGNGGSATAATDFAYDCTMPPSGPLRPVPAISLAAEVAVVSAIANDIGAEAIFLRQLVSHARAGDVAVGFSTSGSSANVNHALAEANKRGLLTVALAGRDGGLVAEPGRVDFKFVVPSPSVHRIQEVQASITHVLREAIDAALPS